MAENSKIEWTHHTFNPWRGCSKVSPGCEHCYAATQSLRNPGTLGTWGPKGTRVVASESMWREPLKWDAKAKAAGDRHRVFCASMADVFEDWQGPITDSSGREMFSCVGCAGWPLLSDMSHCPSGCKCEPLTMGHLRKLLFSLIDATPNLDWLLLTKRPENVESMMPRFLGPLERRRLPNGEPDRSPEETIRVITNARIRPNVWLGVSVENQEQADKRIPILLQTPAAVRFLSCEPLLSAVDLLPYMAQYVGDPDGGERFAPLPDTGIHWVIVGGESGHGARPCNYYWLKSIVDQCQAAAVPVFVKQWGARPFFDKHDGGKRYDDHTYHKLNDRKGGDISEWPEDLRVRGFPKTEVPAQ